MKRNCPSHVSSGRSEVLQGEINGTNKLKNSAVKIKAG